LDEAKQVLQRAIANAPKALEEGVRGRSMRPEDYEHVLDGLRKAGWEG
jgi:adenylate cyclase